jgi:hypothetical protein
MSKVGNPVVKGAFGRLFGSATGRVLDVLVLHRGHDLSHKELAEYAGVSTKSLSKDVLPKLFKFGLAKETRRIGHAKMLTLDMTSNPIVDHLVACEFELSLKEADE